MLFLTLSKIDRRFAEQEFVWRTYMTTKALSTTRRVEIINKREFMAAALNVDDETFVMYIAALAELTIMPIYSSYQAQVALLTSKENGILAEYLDFSNVFFLDSTMKLLEHTRINNHPINLLDDKQPLYSPIYSLRLVELEKLKIYIKANLASGFIKPSKFPAGASILFV